MWSAYSTRDAAEFVGLSESAIRSCVRVGLLSSDRSRLRFSFRDLLVLKMVKELVASGLSLGRARRELADLRTRYPEEAPLSSLTVAASGGHVVVREGPRVYRADSGQLFLDLEMPTATDTELTPFPTRLEAEGPEPGVDRSVEEWLTEAARLEEAEPQAAIAAYMRALELRPDCAETAINLGRLYAELGEVELAEECFSDALRENPADPTALYNLGVVAQDKGKDDDAVRYYRDALKLDPEFAEAHYNLATIFDRTGESQAAIRHINEYRKLTR